MTKTPTPEQLQAAADELPNGYVPFVSADYLRKHRERVDFALRFTAKALGETSSEIFEVMRKNWGNPNRHEVLKAMIQQLCRECAETGKPCRINTGNQYTHGTGVCVDCGQKPIAGITNSKELGGE